MLKSVNNKLFNYNNFQALCISYEYVNFVKMFQLLFKNLRKSFYINFLNNLSTNNCILNLTYCLKNIIIKMIIFFLLEVYMHIHITKNHASARTNMTYMYIIIALISIK